LNEESVQHVVKSIAGAPIDQQEERLKAFMLLKVGDPVGSCTLQDVPEEIKPANIAYCQGVTAPIGEKPNAIRDKKGTHMEHKTPTQSSNMQSKNDANHWESTLYYVTATGFNDKERTEAVKAVLAEFGIGCKEGPQGSHQLECTVKGTDGLKVSIADQDMIRRAAIFLSSIDKIAELPKVCVPKAISYAKNHAIGINTTSKPWTVPIYPATGQDWMKLVCNKV
jgi:hypothetical protein